MVNTQANVPHSRTVGSKAVINTNERPFHGKLVTIHMQTRANAEEYPAYVVMLPDGRTYGPLYEEELRDP